MRPTRGMMRHEAKQDRRRKQLPDGSLIVGLDIGKRRHAAWMIDAVMRPLGRAKVPATPAGIRDLLRLAEGARIKAQLDRAIVAFEPTSHF